MLKSALDRWILFSFDLCLVSGFLYEYDARICWLWLIFLSVFDCELWASNYIQEPAYLPQRNQEVHLQWFKWQTWSLNTHKYQWRTDKSWSWSGWQVESAQDLPPLMQYYISAEGNIKCWFSVRLQSKLGRRTKRDNSHFCGNLTHWFIQRYFVDRVRADGAFERVVTFFGSSLNHKMATISFSSQQSKPCDHAHCPLLSLKNLGLNPQLKSRKIASIVRRHLCGAP